jgi:hypothetical protein
VKKWKAKPQIIPSLERKGGKVESKAKNPSTSQAKRQSNGKQSNKSSL